MKFEDVFVAGRVADLGGWEKIERLMPTATKSRCEICNETVVISPQGRQFIADKGPMPTICFQCSQTKLRDGGAVELGHERDDKTGTLRVHHGLTKKPD